jgi:hypothetical protein
VLVDGEEAMSSSVAVSTWSLVSVVIAVPGSLKVLEVWCASL